MASVKTAEPGIPGQAVNLRFRDGSIYQSSATDDTGQYELTEIFPFFNWMTTEVDFTRFKATGATVVVDGGGPVPDDQGWTMPSRNKLNPQQQSAADGGGLYRSETGPVLAAGHADLPRLDQPDRLGQAAVCRQ